MTGLTPGDLALIGFAARRDEEMRGGIAALARLGVKLRRADPARAKALIEQFETHPFYKAGQTLFDLWEMEDFLLDGDPPPLAPAALAATLTALAARLQLPPLNLPELGDLPALEAGFYLYRDVVLGLLGVMSDTLASAPDFIR